MEWQVEADDWWGRLTGMGGGDVNGLQVHPSETGAFIWDASSCLESIWDQSLGSVSQFPLHFLKEKRFSRILFSCTYKRNYIQLQNGTFHWCYYYFENDSWNINLNFEWAKYYIFQSNIIMDTEFILPCLGLLLWSYWDHQSRSGQFSLNFLVKKPMV